MTWGNTPPVKIPTSYFKKFKDLMLFRVRGQIVPFAKPQGSGSTGLTMVRHTHYKELCVISTARGYWLVNSDGISIFKNPVYQIADKYDKLIITTISRKKGLLNALDGKLLIDTLYSDLKMSSIGRQGIVWARLPGERMPYRNRDCGSWILLDDQGS